MTTATLCDSCLNAQVPCSGRTCASLTRRVASWLTFARRKLSGWLACRDPDEHYLAQSTDHADFARRERILELNHEVRLSRLRAGVWDFL